MSNGDSKFPLLRKHIHPDFAEASDQTIEAVLRARAVDAEAVEGFLDDLGKFASSAGKAIVAAAPTVLPIAGQVVGTAFGGPVGAAIGGRLGSLAGGAIGAATGQRPGGAAPGIPGAGALLGSPAAGQLLQTILRPETLQGLLSMFMGPAGRPNVPVGGTPVPAGAFSNLLGVLANQASAEYNASLSAANGSIPRYMQDYAGEAIGDPAVAEQRAEALYELLRGAESEQEGSESVESAEYEQYRLEMEAVNLEYDAKEILEMYEMSEEY